MCNMWEDKMNTKFKILIVFIVLLSIMITSVLYGCDNNNFMDKNEAVEELSSWMSMIKDDTLVKELVIPGSHDSGTKDMSNVFETQDQDYYDQLKQGVRYFDTRVMYSNDDFYMFHTAKGELKYQKVLDDVNKFLTENPSEFIVLDFQYLDGGKDEMVFDMLEDTLGKDKLVNVSGSAIDFVNNLKVGEMRGKCLVFVGKDQSELNRPYQISRDKDTEPREGSALHSYYIKSYNTSSSEIYLSEHISKYIDMYKESNGGLFVLQGQLTHKLVGDIKEMEEGHDANMNKYVYDLYNSENLQYINIIMRDFVNCEKSSYILRLNIAKDNIKTDMAEEYKNMLANYISL